MLSMHVAAAANAWHAHGAPPEGDAVAAVRHVVSAVSSLLTQLPAGSHDVYAHWICASAACAHGWLHGSASARQPGRLIWKFDVPGMATAAPYSMKRKTSPPASS